MEIVDDISRMRIWNLYVIPRLRKIIDKMMENNRTYAYVDYEFASDKMNKFKMVSKSALRKRFINRSERGEESYENCMKDIIMEKNTIILVIFYYSKLFTFCPTIFKINRKNIDKYLIPIKLTYEQPYQKNIWFRDEVLIDMYKQIDNKLVSSALEKIEEEEILVIERNYAKNNIFFKGVNLDEYIEYLKLLLVHQDVIKKIEKIKRGKAKILIFCINNYYVLYFVLVRYDKKNNKYTELIPL